MRRRLPTTVFALGWVSFCTDLGSEMVMPLLPGLLAGLGASLLELGLLQGLGDLAVSALKLLAGWLSDRQRSRKPWIVAGYAVSSLLRPLPALAVAPWQVVVARAGERVGKGLRSAPRDALLADVVSAADRGAAYGLQRALDHAGALAGALVAAALVALGCSTRSILAAALLPGVLSLALLVWAVREPSVARGPAAVARGGDLRPLLPFLLVVVLASAGGGIDLFLLARARELGASPVDLPLLWAVLHVVRAGLSAPLGALSDRLGRRRVLASGLVAQAIVLVLFAALPWRPALWPLFALHGLHAAFCEGAERGYVADLTGADRRGRVFGVYHAVQGVAAFAAPLAVAWTWERVGADAALGGAAAAAVVALVALVCLVRAPRAD